MSEHGTYRYGQGCRCPRCRKAHSDAQRLRNRAWSAAYRRLRRAHPEEFARYYADEAAPLGIRVGQPGRPKAVSV